MDPPHIDKKAVLQQFDRLQKAGDLLWTPSTSIVNLVDRGFPHISGAKFEFRVTPAQKTKPSFPDGVDESTSSSDDENEPKQQNGNAKSDIDNFLPEWHIAHVNNTHRLILNKFNIYRPQYVLLTACPSKRQTSLLEKSDFCAAWTMLQELKEPHFLIFNCGKQAGGSRMHKHMQIFEQDRDELLPDRLLLEEALEKTIPYKYSLSSLQSQEIHGPSQAADLLHRIYQGHIEKCASDLGLPRDSYLNQDVTIPHNIVLTTRWLMTIPRTQAGLGPATANAAGFLGLVWVPEESVIDLWKELGPAHVLASLGVPAEA